MALLPTRKRQQKKPTTLPKDFLRTVSDLFQKQFKKNLAGSTFLVYGDLYGDEAVLGVSLSHPKSLGAASLHVSADLPKNVSENPEKVTAKLQSMVDVAASWFSQCFQAGNGLETVLGEMKDADTSWQELDWEGAQLFVKLNRTNYTLEKAADEFLKKKGFDLEGEDPLDELDEDDETEPLN
jgi:hypothetical protein